MRGSTVGSNCLIDSYRPNINKIVWNIIEHKILWCSEYAGLASNRETHWSRPRRGSRGGGDVGGARPPFPRQNIGLGKKRERGNTKKCNKLQENASKTHGVLDG